MAIAARLLAWFDHNRRDLPWRKSRDPWSIWVSEVMLQQTRVEAVRAAYERFVARYPTPADFANVGDDELMQAWRGLGYYRRARLLREGARSVVRDHGGKVPSDPDALGRLPGIGSYTRGAIASIAFEHPEPAVDGNVERVVARHRGIATDVKAAPAQRIIRAFAAEQLDSKRPGDFNQALMELGAVICTPSSPRCELCPVADDCIAHVEGETDRLPVRKPRRVAVGVTARAVLLQRKDSALGVRVPDDEPNAGQVELPGAGILVDVDAGELAAVLLARYGAQLEIGRELASIRHAITHHRIRLVAHTARIGERGRLEWFGRGDGTPWTTPARKIFQATSDRLTEPGDA